MCDSSIMMRDHQIILEYQEGKRSSLPRGLTFIDYTQCSPEERIKIREKEKRRREQWEQETKKEEQAFLDKYLEKVLATLDDSKKVEPYTVEWGLITGSIFNGNHELIFAETPDDVIDECERLCREEEEEKRKEEERQKKEQKEKKKQEKKEKKEQMCQQLSAMLHRPLRALAHLFNK